MTPDIVVDIGNTRMKWGLVSDGRVAEVVRLKHDDPVGWKRQLELWALAPAETKWAAAAVVPLQMLRFREWLTTHQAAWIELTTADLAERAARYRFKTTVDQPSRLGVDRFLTSLAARVKSPATASVVVLNVGTAMTVDFVKRDGTHVGGAILPGPRLMARSLHKHTAQLPLVKRTPAVPNRRFGTNTKDAIELGIASATLGAADQLIWDWTARYRSPPWVFVTGGDAGYFRGFAFTADVGHFEIDPKLTLEGIRLAAEALP